MEPQRAILVLISYKTWSYEVQKNFWGSKSEDQFAANLVYSQRHVPRNQTHTAESKKTSFKWGL